MQSSAPDQDSLPLHPSIRDLQRSEALEDMIARLRWIPGKSGWRPFASAEEAAIIAKETLVLRGCNWMLEAVSLEQSSGLFRQWLSYTDRFNGEREFTYEELFRSAKVLDGGVPCGLPRLNVQIIRGEL